MEEGRDWDWTEAIKLEYYIWDIQVQQELRGVCFDKERAEELLAYINEEIYQIEAEVIPKIPMRPSNDGELKKIFLKSGEYTEPVKEWMDETV
jgi:hypothetical protein